MFHAPTTEQTLFQNPGQRKDGRLPKNARALAYAIYLFAATSLTNEECEQATGESRPVILARFREAGQVALIKASVLRTSDIVVLQAFVLFLMAVRQYYDARSLWVLAGIAVRIGQRMGIHRDGTGMNLSPFETEIRRRLWWTVIILDRTTAEISGAGQSDDFLAANRSPLIARPSQGSYFTTYAWDAKVPLNVNDSDWDPDMTEFPKEKEGATEMMFCLMRYELGDLFRTSNYLQPRDKTDYDIPWNKLSSKQISVSDKDRAIEELQRRFEQKYLRYCDPLNKLHYLVSVVSRSIIAMLYMITHHPRQYPDKGASMPQEEKDMLFEKALKIIGERNSKCNQECGLKQTL